MGIKSRAVLPSDFDPGRALRTCDRILRLTANGSTATSIVNELPRFWISLTGLTHASNLNAIESCITRIFCMRGALRFHYWLLEIVPAAVKHMSDDGNLWINRLAWDVKTAIYGKQSANFESKKYLPGLAFHSVYSFTPSDRHGLGNETLFNTVLSIIRRWFQYPTDELSLVQLSLIDIISSQSPTSVMFLDKIWEMYRTPFSTVFNGWNAHTSKSKMNQELELFNKRYSSHPFAKKGSLAYKKLQHLDQLINIWMEKNAISKDVADAVRQMCQ